MDEFSVEFPHEGVALLRLNRPPANALTTGTVEELTRTLDELAESSIGVVLASDNPRFFCAGGDINDFATMSTSDIEFRMSRFHQWLVRLETYPAPLSCAVSGIAVGAGCEILLHADRVFASPGARLGFPEIANGVLPAGKGIKDLIATVGKPRARELLLTGALVNAERGLDIGLVDEIVDESAVIDAAVDFVVTAKSRSPILYSLLKTQIRELPVKTDDEAAAASITHLRTYRDDSTAKAARARWEGRS